MMSGIRRMAVLAGFCAILCVPVAGAWAQSGTNVAQRIVELINQARQQAGLQPVTVNPMLNAAAAAQANDIAAHKQMSHRNAQGEGLDQRLRNADYIASVEIEVEAAGIPTPEEVVSSWLADPSNHASLMNPNVRDIGVAYVFHPADVPPNDGWRYYWVVELGLAVERGPGP